MMHLCIVATLCFFKIISPRNYYYCDQDDFPWVYGSKYVSKSNCCQRLFVFYILDVKSFHTYRNINISNLQSDPLIIIGRRTKLGEVASERENIVKKVMQVSRFFLLHQQSNFFNDPILCQILRSDG